MIKEIIKNKEVIVDRDLARINLGIEYSMSDYYDFMKMREVLPRYDFEYIDDVPWLITDKINLDIKDYEYENADLSKHLFDYQEYFIKHALEKTKFAMFLDTGLGKTSIEIEFAVQLARNGIKSLIVCPLLVLTQFKREINKFYPDLSVHLIRKSSLEAFKDSGDMIGLINFEFFRHEKDLNGINGFILDESSILKSEHGVYGKNIISSCNKYNVHYRLAGSATPAPNDYAELANHALFLGKIKTYSQFFGDWFQKDFKDQTKWMLRPHAKDKFYSYLASWSIIMRHPDRFGFKDNIDPPPDYETYIDDLDLTKDQISTANKELLGKDDDIDLWVDEFKKGITVRGKLAQLSKGFIYLGKGNEKYTKRVESNKPAYVYNKCYNEYKNEQFIIWVELDEEEEILKESFSFCDDFAIISGSTKNEDREQIINDFIDCKVRILITKPKIIGFGLNLQHVGYMIYYGISDSYERFYQSLRRCYRRGQERNLQVYIPITELEKPIVDNINLKSDKWETMIEEQENYFKKEKNGTNN